jgi:hypothetical protein
MPFSCPGGVNTAGNGAKNARKAQVHGMNFGKSAGSAQFTSSK